MQKQTIDTLWSLIAYEAHTVNLGQRNAVLNHTYSDTYEFYIC